MDWLPSKETNGINKSNLLIKSERQVNEQNSNKQQSASPRIINSQLINTLTEVPFGKPPALVRIKSNNEATMESISDGDLSDFSLNDTEEEDDECLKHKYRHFGEDQRFSNNSPRNSAQSSLIRTSPTADGLIKSNVLPVRKIFTNTRERWRLKL